jgi:outer membrane receptor for ferrienterochelin and colicin
MTYLLNMEQTHQWYDNSKGQLGTLGANGGYAEAQKYNRDKYILAHTWRSEFGNLESSISNIQTETIGRLIPLVRRTALNPSRQDYWKAKIRLLILNLPLNTFLITISL